MRGSRVVVALLATVTMAVAVSSSVSAQDATDPPEILPVSSLIISAYSVIGEQPRYIELYNDSDELVVVEGWTIRISWTLRQSAPAGSSALVVAPLSVYTPLDDSVPYIVPGGYVVVGFNGAVANALSQMTLTGLPNFAYVSEIRLENPEYRPYIRALTEAQSTAGSTMRLNQGATGYTTTYGTVNSDKIYQNEEGYYYAPTGGFALAPVEILANPKSCSPLDGDSSCLEYVKFYNHTTAAVDFSGVRLRAGSTTTVLDGVIASGEYGIFAVSLPNTGGYVSLEDTYGVHTYENTVVEYPDASPASRRGVSWALIEGVWQWAVPSPSGANTAIVVKEVKDKEDNLTPCRADQYRSPETNRCRLIASTSSSSKPCAANQYRSPDTNRCRNIASSSSVLTPCAANQYRSPETNRCRSVASAVSALTPCAANQERNPDTNRCRAVLAASMPTADFPVEADGESNDQSLGWVAFVGVGGMALAYAGWEWRYEITGIFRKLKESVTKA